MSSSLTPKQEKFCNKYIECGNASEAYRFAYSCAKMKAETVNNKAYQLLIKGEITARVAELQVELKAKSDITKEQILNHLSAILQSKITDYLDFDGFRITWKSFDRLSESQIRAVESIKETKDGLFELKLHGKSWTIERICKMLGFDAPTKGELTGKDGKPLIPESDYSKLTDTELDQLYTLLKKADGK